MNEEKRMNGGYKIIESCTIGSNELVIGYNPKAPIRMSVGTAKTARIISGVITAMSCSLPEKS